MSHPNSLPPSKKQIVFLDEEAGNATLTKKVMSSHKILFFLLDALLETIFQLLHAPEYVKHVNALSCLCLMIPLQKMERTFAPNHSFFYRFIQGDPSKMGQS